MPHLDRFKAPLGLPAYSRPDVDNLEFVLEGGRSLSDGRSFRAVTRPDQWQLANCVFLKGGPLVVSDFRGRDNVYRTWRVEPTTDPGLGQGVILHPLHEGEFFFRGRLAVAVEPLMLSQAMRPLIRHIEGHETFNRVSAASETGKGWGDVSRDMSLLHNYGFIRATGERTTYSHDSPEVLGLKSERDRELGAGNKMNYEKTASWPRLLEQFEAMLASKAKRVEVEI